MKPSTFFGAVLLAALAHASALAATPCEALTTLTLANARVTSSVTVAAGAFVAPVTQRGGRGAVAEDPDAVAAPARGGRRGTTNPYANLPAFCRVSATLAPSSDSDIKVELWLPASGWNGKFQAVGNGGWAGTIPYTAIGGALSAGYAAAGTDTGHTGGNADFALGHPEKLIDFGYRSIHEMTVQSKVILATYYGSPAKYSYYNGCSQGGRQGLAEAQRYPEDFNGIIAGASAIDQMRMHGARTALSLEMNKNPDSVIPRTKYAMINTAVLNACDALDGVKDGVIENPEKCKFDYAKLRCKAGDSPDCLTKGQVESAKIITSPLKDPKTGKTIFSGHLLPGAELGWATLGGPQPLGLSVSGMRNIVFQDRNWDPAKMDVAADFERAAHSDGGAMETRDPNLKPFFDRGGKLLMYHGWSDPQVTPLNSVSYYESVVKVVGKSQASKSIRLFMMPGVNHCSGGPGTDTFDKIEVMEEWVEQGKTPSRIVASHSTAGVVDKTRPLCAYDQTAKYDGSGDTNDAANFTCK
jgi:feruloyl esterase